MGAAFPRTDQLLIAPEIRERIAVSALDLTRTGTGLLAVRMQLANCSSTDLVLRVRTQFLDSSGANSEMPSTWHDVFLGARSVAEYHESAFSLQAEAVRVELDVES